jgi:putative oxidoreductase
MQGYGSGLAGKSAKPTCQRPRNDAEGTTYDGVQSALDNSRRTGVPNQSEDAGGRDTTANDRSNDVIRLDPIWSDRALSVLRIITALLFLQHGLAKHFGFPHVASFDNLQVFSLLGLAGAIEIVGSVLVLVGLFTRPAAFIVSGEMAVAYFMSHAPRGFFPILNGGELAVLFCFVFLFFAIAGGGAWSLDRYIGKTPDPLSRRPA